MGIVKKALNALLDLAGLDAGRTVWNSRGLPESGYTMLPHDWQDHIYRVTPGQHLQLSLVLYSWRLTAGVCGKNDTVQEWTPWVKVKCLVEKFGCEWADSIHDALENGQARGLWKFEERRGEVRVSLLPANWPKMQHCKKCLRVHLVGGECIKIRVVEKKTPELKPLNGVRYGNPVTFEKGSERDFTPDQPAAKIRISFRDGDGLVARFGVDQDGLAAIECWQLKTETKELPPHVSGFKPKITDPVVQQIADVIGSYGPVTLPRIAQMIAACHAPADQVLLSLAEVKPNEGVNDPVPWMLSMVPRYFSGEYKPASAKKKVSARDQRAYDALNSMLGRGKIA